MYSESLPRPIIISIIIGPIERQTTKFPTRATWLITIRRAHGLISGFVERRYVECQEDVHDGGALALRTGMLLIDHGQVLIAPLSRRKTSPRFVRTCVAGSSLLIYESLGFRDAKWFGSHLSIILAPPDRSQFNFYARSGAGCAQKNIHSKWLGSVSNPSRLYINSHFFYKRRELIWIQSTF